jgi:hypothetical protein
MKTTRSLLLMVPLLFCCSLAGAVDAPAGSQEQTGKPIDVLFIGRPAPRDQQAPLWRRYHEACLKEGVRVFGHEFALHGQDSYETLTPEVLRRFHVVVVHGTPAPSAGKHATPADEQAAATFRDNLDVYSRAGGGVLWVPTSKNMNGASAWNAAVGTRIGATALEEDLYDPGLHIDVNTTGRKHRDTGYLWTSDIAPHPVTAGVRGLLLPRVGDWSWPGTVPMRYGDDWTVLVKGMASTRTIGNAAAPGSGKRDFTLEVAGTYAGAPHLAATREGVAGTGRMLVFPVYAAHTWLNFGHRIFNDALMLNGYGGRPSDGHRLLLNAYKWLAEPAVKAGGFGGYQPLPPVVAVAPEPFDWRTTAFPVGSWSGLSTFWNAGKQADTPLEQPTAARDFHGIIGARTVASGGTGTVADYVAEAKALGLSFVVFLEHFEQLDEAGYQRLVADCAAATDDQFAAIPGYLIRDETGVRYFFFGKGLTGLPAPENLTPDRRIRVTSALYFQYGHDTAQGLVDLGSMAIDPNYLWHFSCMSPYTYEGATLADDGLDRHLSMEGRGHNYAPTAVVQLDAPAQMASAVAGGAKLTVIHEQTLADALHIFGRKADPHPKRIYITNGPRIARWGAINPIGHPFWPGKQRVRFALEAASEDGIAEVKIIDAGSGTVLRRFAPGGATSFSCIIDETHRQQWSLVPVVTDTKGRTAVGGAMQTFQDGNRLWMMGERFNSMRNALTWDPARTRLLNEGGWVSGWAKRGGNDNAGNWPSMPRVSEPLNIIGIDGGKLHQGGNSISPKVVTDLGTEPAVSAYRFHPRLASFDLAVMDFDGSSQFMTKKPKDPKIPHMPNPDPQVPMEIADIQVRCTAVRPRGEGDIAANVHEVTVTFLKDAELKEVSLGWYELYEPAPTLLAVQDADGEEARMLSGEERHRRSGILPAGGYVQSGKLGGAARGLINLGPEPLAFTVENPTKAFFRIPGGRRVKAGEVLRARFLAFEGANDLPSTNAWLKSFIAGFGIGREKPGYPLTVSQGRVRSSNYHLQLASAEGGAVAEIGRYPLPHNLLVSADNIPANAVAGRYDTERRQLLILPVLDGAATTSVNTTLGDTKLYIGELFHCDNQDLVLSCVQDGADKLLLEVHNPTDKDATVKLAAATGFTPLAGLDKTLSVPAASSVKLELPTAKGSLEDKPYEGD